MQADSSQLTRVEEADSTRLLATAVQAKCCQRSCLLPVLSSSLVLCLYILFGLIEWTSDTISGHARGVQVLNWYAGQSPVLGAIIMFCMIFLLELTTQRLQSLGGPNADYTEVLVKEASRFTPADKAILLYHAGFSGLVCMPFVIALGWSRAWLFL